MVRGAVVLGCGALVAGILTGVRPALAGSAPGAGSGVSVVIRRTAYGIPHVQAGDYRSLGYGAGYAFAQDNPCALVEQALTLAGDRSRWFGPDASAPTLLIKGTAPRNIDSDLFYRALNATGAVQRQLNRPAPFGPTAQVRAFVDGYAAGYDRYLRDQTVARLPDPSCRGAAWVRPITPLDLYRRAYQFATLGGTGVFASAITAAAPPAPAAPPDHGAPPAPAAPPDAAPVLDNVIGSNGLALGADATRDGGGMVLANPHGPWSGASRFYQIQLTIPGQLDVSGASLYGLPLVMPFGHTAHLGFSATASADRQYTVERLALAPGDPTSYLVDGHRYAMIPLRLTVPVRDANGTTAARNRTVYWTADGPVIQLPGTYDWTSTTAYVLHDAAADDLRGLNEMLAVDRADSIDQLRHARSTYQGITTLNIFAADASGTAFYQDSSLVPHLTDAQAAACTIPGTAVLDGSRSACRPGSDPDAVEAGIFGPAEMPHLTRRDYVANSNGSPWLINPAQPLQFPQIIGPTGNSQRPRDRLGIDMVTGRMAGTDGLGPAGFTVDTLTATALGDRDFFGEQWRDDLVGFCRTHPKLTASNGQRVDVRAGCTALAGWDLHANLDSRGEVLFREVYNRLTGGAEPDPALWAVPFDVQHPMTTPRGLDTAVPAVGRALADAVAYLTSLHVPLDVPLGSVQRVTTPTGPIPVHGCSESCYNIVAPSVDRLGTGGVYPDVFYGASFLMAVELTPAGPRGRTLLAYGESENPASPHHWDQTRLFSAKQWVTDRFTPADIAADPQLTTTVLTG